MVTRCGWILVATTLAVVFGAPAGGLAVEQGCRGGHAAGSVWAGPVCGPRYHGAVHEGPNRPDPCDSCNRWRGCDGGRQFPDMLAPWQMPPGRGFRSPEQMGWRGGPCTTCGPRVSAH